ncbi:MAG TPA: ABC transporter substrate-binding protein [Sandaracinaceae bacterium LLY-WYZ-13_1]|nr:ABC transporter substrate-binding protein [Sandaracinaceae bacterium LLY-WYZ-13_1]
MRSTRRSEAYAGLVALALFGAVVVAIGAFMPPAPDAPRYRGAGHETPQRGGTFVFHHESDVRGLDPHKSFDELSNMAIKLLFEGLVDYDRDTMEFIPRLAEALPEVSEDGRTYRYTLRQGVRFADDPCFEGGRGREVTAEDVRWSLEHMLAPQTGSPGATFYTLIEGYDAYRAGEASHVAGIRVIDRYTIEIQLTRPDQTFPYTMAMTFAYPVAREAYATYGDEIRRHPVGTGAFVLESWEPGVELTFARNPSFFEEGEPYVDRMIYQVNLRRIPAVMRFRNGDLDHIHRQTPADYLALRDMPAWEPYRVQRPKTNIWGVAMNCQLAPFDNRHLRRAVAFAINRERWRRARANRLVLQGQPIPRTLPGFDEELPGRHVYDLERAREEMRLAGYPDGLDEEVEVWLGEGETGRAYGELIQSDLAEIGIDVRIKQVAFPIYLQETGKPGTAQMLLTGWSMDFPDPANFLDILFHTRSIHEEDSENKAFYSNPELDEILDRARVQPDHERRMAMYREASEILVDDAPWAFVFSDLAMEMWQPYVRNYRPHSVWDNFYRDVWLDLPRRRAGWHPLRRGPGGRFAVLPPGAWLGALR